MSPCMDPDLPATDESKFPRDASKFPEHCRDAREELPRKFPRSGGKLAVTAAFVDASHAADKVTQRSHSGHILLVSRAPVKWHGKRQTTVETSAFSSEFVAMECCIEDIEHLRFKLRMFGIPLGENEPETGILCDNEAVLKNSSRVESAINKRHPAAAHHFARWNVEAKVCSAGWIPATQIIADAVTKLLPETKCNASFHDWVHQEWILGGGFQASQAVQFAQ